MIRVVVADDHPLLRAGLRHILDQCSDIEFAAEAENGNDLISCLRQEAFDVVVTDMFMPGKHGMELLKQLKNEFPKIPVLILSTHKEDIYAMRTLKAGAAGYLCKDYAGSELVNAIRKVAGGGRFISPAVAELMACELHAPAQDMLPHTLLSDREYQVFMLIVGGNSVSDIAEQLNLSVKTVSTHKLRIKEKTKLGNEAEMVRYALQHRLVQ